MRPWLPPVDQDPDEAQDAACRIVERTQDVCRPVETLPPPPGEGASSGGFLDVVGLLLWIALFAVVGFLLFLLVRYLAERNGWSRRGGDGGDDDSGEEVDVIESGAVVVDRSREPTNWRTEAERHRAAGRYRDAVRCRYRALVGDLARRGLIDEIPGRTTGEEREQLRVVTPPASEPFDEAAELFDEAWYGHVAVDDAAVGRFQTLEQTVLDRTAAQR